MIDWKRKLSSRKFWAAVALFISGLVTFIASPTTSPEAIGGLVLQFGAVVAYIVGEGFTDGKNVTINSINPDDLVYNELPADLECTSEDGVAAGDDEEYEI